MAKHVTDFDSATTIIAEYVRAHDSISLDTAVVELEDMWNGEPLFTYADTVADVFTALLRSAEFALEFDSINGLCLTLN